MRMWAFLAALVVTIFTGAAPELAQSAGSGPSSSSIAEANQKGLEALERQDFASAMQWFRMSADQGDANAQFLVGTMYQRGRGVPEDATQAVHWYRLAAEQGQVKAQFFLGWAYIVAMGVPKDYAQAEMWLGKAAAQGDADAKAKLAELQSALAAVKEQVTGNEDAQAAFKFVQRQATIDLSLAGRPEPELSRLQATDGDICRLRCGYHIATSLHDVADIEHEFALSEIAPSTLTWEMDGNGRAFVKFGSSAGTADFRVRARSRKVEILSFDQKPLSDWTKWSEWKTAEKVVCRSNPDKTDLDRVLKAYAVLATACGARRTPF
jgi:Sel1 repeat